MQRELVRSRNSREVNMVGVESMKGKGDEAKGWWACVRGQRERENSRAILRRFAFCLSKVGRCCRVLSR